MEISGIVIFTAISRLSRWFSTPAGLSTDTAWNGPVFIFGFLIALALGAMNLADPDADRLPISGDSAKYHTLAETVEHLLQNPSQLAALLTNQLTAEEREALHIERWEFQHAPAYVLTLGTLYAIFPNNEGVGRALSIICFAISAGLLLITGSWLLGHRWIWIAYLVFLLYLPHLYYATAIATEMFSVCVLLLCSWQLFQMWFHPTRRQYVIGSLVCALLFLAKTTFRPLAVLLMIFQLVVMIRKRCRVGKMIGFAIGAIAPLLLWYLFLMISAIPLDPLSQSGESQLWLYRGNYVPDQGWETIGIGDAITPQLHRAGNEVRAAGGPDMAEDDQRRRMYTRAIRYTIAEYPLEWLALVAKKFGLFWTYPARKWYLDTAIGSWAASRAVHQWMFLLGLLGLTITLRRSPVFWLPGLLVCGVGAIHAFSHLVARYNIPALGIGLIYGLLGLRVLWHCAMGLRRHRRWRTLSWRHTIWRWLIAGALVSGVGALLMALPGAWTPQQARFIYLTGSVLRGIGLLAAGPVVIALARMLRRSIGNSWRYWSGPALLSVVVIGTGISNRDWDQMSITLSREGDSVIQRIVYTDRDIVQRGGVESASLIVDMLRSTSGNFNLAVIVNGEELHTFSDSLGGSYQSFLFDQQQQQKEGRFCRVADTNQRYVTDYLNRRYGDKSPGYDYFRRWVRIDLPLEKLKAGTVEVELKLVSASDGAWVRFYGDRFTTDGQVHYYEGPSFTENLFEHSNYRAEFYGGDRERMDSRLVMRKELSSPGCRSSRQVQGTETSDLLAWPGKQTGELRIRLQVKMRGQMVLRPSPEGDLKRVWTVQLKDQDKLLDEKQLRQFQTWRQRYFDGVWNF
jgi:hypothetical protein